MEAGEAKTLLGLWLEHAGRALQPAQREEVLEKFGRSDGLPLYLRLAFEEARLWRSYTPAAETVLHEGVQDLIRKNLFPRLSEPSNHGPVLVANALGYLAASRFGLSEDEVLDVLSLDGAVLDDFAARSFQELPERKLPIVAWSRLYFDVAPYLAERSAEKTTLLAFYHNQLREAATAECLAGERAQERNAALASYFRGRSDPAKDRSWTGEYPRGLSELPFHLAGAGDKDELYETLTDFTFLEHKVADVAVAEHPGPDGNMTTTYAGVYASRTTTRWPSRPSAAARPGARSRSSSRALTSAKAWSCAAPGATSPLPSSRSGAARTSPAPTPTARGRCGSTVRRGQVEMAKAAGSGTESVGKSRGSRGIRSGLAARGERPDRAA